MPDGGTYNRWDEESAVRSECLSGHAAFCDTSRKGARGKSTVPSHTASDSVRQDELPVPTPGRSVPRPVVVHLLDGDKHLAAYRRSGSLDRTKKYRRHTLANGRIETPITVTIIVRESFTNHCSTAVLPVLHRLILHILELLFNELRPSQLVKARQAS